MIDFQIETERLRLRRLLASDFDALLSMVSKPEMWRFPERLPMTGEEAWNLLLRHEGHWGLKDFGVLLVEERQNRGFVGLAGPSHFHRSLGEGFDTYPELTWSITPDMQGLGYGIEAARAALEWVDDNLPFEMTVCLIHERNVASLRVAEQVGYVPDRTLEYRGDTAVQMSRPARPTRGLITAT